MLQQTTVAAVIPYFDRFLQRFPTVQDLATAPLDDVMRLWEGLGYYSRARNLHAAAQHVVTHFGAQFPADVDRLQKLPGVGRYTAGAIASFAFDLPAPIVEANTARLFARLLALDRELKTTAAQKELWRLAEWLVPRTRPGDFNQAVMDVGAHICRPDDPLCDECPLERHCAARKQGVQDRIPVSSSARSMTDVVELAVVMSRRGRWLVRQYAQGERWAGLWDFVRMPLTPDVAEKVVSTDIRKTRQKPARGQRTLFVSEAGQRPDDRPSLPGSVLTLVQQRTGMRIEASRELMQMRHVVTRYRIRLAVHEVTQFSGRKSSDHHWKSAEQLRELAMPVTGRKILSAVLDGRQ